MTVRLRLTCGESVRQVAFDRSSISVGRGPFNDVVFADGGLARVHGELEVGDDASLAFRARASSSPTRIIRQGTCVQTATGDEEQLLRLQVHDTLRLGEQPSVELEIVEVDISPGACWSTLELPDVEQVHPSPQESRVLRNLTRSVTDSPDVETLLRGIALFVSYAAGAAPRRLEVAIPIETEPWRSDDHMLRQIAVDLSAPPDQLSLTCVEGSFMRTRDPLPPFGAAAAAIVRELKSLEHYVVTRSDEGLANLLVPLELDGRLAAVLDLSFVAALEDPLLESAARAAALMQPLAAVVLGRERQDRHCEGLREENRYWRQRQRRHYLFKNLIAESQSMRAVYDELNALVAGTQPVLIVGEAGTGKALLARALHHLGPRKDRMLTSLNCREVSGELLDFELFGSVANELSGDLEPRTGVFELAERGTVLLEEIDRLSPMLQGKLLRMLREDEVRRIGDAIARRVNVRLLASTHRDLGELVDKGQFRRDLHLALAEHVLTVPPLRQRRADVLPLARTFVETFADRYDRPCRRISETVREKLLAHRWQGNVRELKAVLEAAVLNCDGEFIDLDDLGL